MQEKIVVVTMKIDQCTEADSTLIKEKFTDMQEELEGLEAYALFAPSHIKRTEVADDYIYVNFEKAGWILCGLN